MDDSESPCVETNPETTEAPQEPQAISSNPDTDADSGTASTRAEHETEVELGRGVEVVDDFIRNFCVRNGMLETLQSFENEWHDRVEQGVLTADRICDVHDQYALNTRLEENIAELEKEIRALQMRFENEKRGAVTLKKERDAHRLHHKRIAQEKNTLTDEIKRLKAENASCLPRIQDLQRKYETQLKEKSMIAHEKEKLQRKLAEIEKERIDAEGAEKAAKAGFNKSPKRASRSSFLEDFPKRPEEWTNAQPLDPCSLDSSRNLEGHLMAVSNLALHPSQPMVVSVSDDQTWKLWRLTDGELLMTGTGHTDWISGVDFHPNGDGVATASGDGTVKLWDFHKEKCVTTFHENQAVWSVHYHATGDAIATASLDHVARIWDLHAEKCRTVFRGHSDSVNEVVWHPWRPVLSTASSDRTVSLWDARMGQCVVTLYGHTNACNHCSYAPDGQLLTSCDADGVVKTWDLRALRERLSISAIDSYPANKCTFDRRAEVLVVACGDGYVRFYEVDSGTERHALLAHDGAVLCVVCDASNAALVTSGSDHCVKYWLSSSASESASEVYHVDNSWG